MHRFSNPVLCFLLTLLLTLSCSSAAVRAESLTQLTNLPTLYINLDNGMSVNQITKGNQLPGTFSMRAEGFEDIDGAAITIKGRGNSTWTLPKKPYQIKFSSKTDLLGMGKAKKWILLANYWDKTLMRNAVTYELANQMNNIFSVECRFVDVYINGEYRGNYLLTEKIEFGGQRIDEDTQQGAVLMELEQQYRHASEGCAPCVITNDGVHVCLKEPEQDEDFSAEQIEQVKSDTLNRLNQIEDALAAGYDAYSSQIDVQSFVDWYIQNELAKNYDAAFVTSTYCYLDAQGILHMGPVWDVDVCFGNQDVTYPDTTDNGLNYYNYRSDKGAWYMRLFKDETFVSLLKARWQEIKEAGYLDQMLNRIEELREYLARSQELETQRWPDAMLVTGVRDQGTGVGGTPYYDFESEVDYFKDWLIRRIDWLDSQWNDAYCDWDRYSQLAQVSGEGLYAGFGSTQNGIWQWTYRTASPANRKMSTSNAFFHEEIATSGKYIASVRFKLDRSRTTDALMLRLVGIDRFGDEYTLLSTIATHVTYAMSPKDEDGYARLNLSFDTGSYRFASFYMEADAYNANVSVKDVALYGAELPTSTARRGDVDQDGTVNAADALLVLKAAVGKATLTQQQQSAASCNTDSKIDAADALLILQYAVEKITVFPADM